MEGNFIHTITKPFDDQHKYEPKLDLEVIPKHNNINSKSIDIDGLIHFGSPIKVRYHGF
jgi:hypothetical protein